jgi:hypothetical protein
MKVEARRKLMARRRTQALQGNSWILRIQGNKPNTATLVGVPT